MNETENKAETKKEFSVEDYKSEIIKCLAEEASERLRKKYGLNADQQVAPISIPGELEKLKRLTESISKEMQKPINKNIRGLMQCQLGKVAHYAYVVMDCKKRHLNWTACKLDNGIGDLYEKYLD